MSTKFQSPETYNGFLKVRTLNSIEKCYDIIYVGVVEFEMVGNEVDGLDAN